MQQLLERGTDVNASGRILRQRTAGGVLRSVTPPETIVKLLLEKGADVNAQGGRHGNALQAASNGGHEDNREARCWRKAQMSMHREDVHGATHCRRRPTDGHKMAIVEAAAEQHKAHDVNAQWRRLQRNALQAASYRGHGRTRQS